MDRAAFIYLDHKEGPVPVGRLWSRIRNGRESATFEYNEGWLHREDRFALEPALALTAGPHHTGGTMPVFGALCDSAPDRWGRVLMRRAERRRAQLEGRTPRTLFEIDFLLSVDDEARAGALRFAAEPGEPFLASADGQRIPILVDLPRLLSATQRVVAQEDTDEDLRLLIAPGSSLGGARPKASVRDADGQLTIAKFPHKDDYANTVVWEAVALTLAERAGIRTATWRLEHIGETAVLLLRRFDRHGPHRFPLLSAMSMLGAIDNEQRSYLEIAEVLQRYGAAPRKDLIELWRRLVFNVLISNTDDHLRNHAFLYEGLEGWRLSPAYDMNPVPIDVKPRILSTSIMPDDPSASLMLALEAAEYFGLKPADANKIAKEVATATSSWRDVAGAYGLSARETERMASAFQHSDYESAQGA